MNTFSDKPIVAEIIEKPKRNMRTFEVLWLMLVVALAIIFLGLIAASIVVMVRVWPY